MRWVRFAGQASLVSWFAYGKVSGTLRVHLGLASLASWIRCANVLGTLRFHLGAT